MSAELEVVFLAGLRVAESIRVALDNEKEFLSKLLMVHSSNPEVEANWKLVCIVNQGELAQVSVESGDITAGWSMDSSHLIEWADEMKALVASKEE